MRRRKSFFIVGQRFFLPFSRKWFCFQLIVIDVSFVFLLLVAALLLQLLVAVLVLLMVVLIFVLLLLVLLLTKDGLIFSGSKVDWETVKLNLEVVTPPGSALQREGPLGWEVQASELNIALPDFSGLVTLKVVLVQRLRLLVPGGANLDPLPADADLIGLALDQVDGNSGVSKSVHAVVDILQRGGNFLFLHALLRLTLELLFVLLGNARALFILRA
jgi:hypothetical protein